MRDIIRASETWGHRLSAFQVPIMQQVDKCAISAWAWVLTFIPWPVRDTKAAMRKSHISAHPLSAWIVSWSWEKALFFGTRLHQWNLILGGVDVTYHRSSIWPQYAVIRVDETDPEWPVVTHSHTEMKGSQWMHYTPTVCFHDVRNLYHTFIQYHNKINIVFSVQNRN